MNPATIAISLQLIPRAAGEKPTTQVQDTISIIGQSPEGACSHLVFCSISGYPCSSRLTHPQAATDLQSRRLGEFDDQGSDASAGHHPSPEGLALLGRFIIDLVRVGEPGGPEDRVFEVRCLDDPGRLAVWIEDAPVLLARHLVINPHRTDEDETPYSGLSHRLHDASGLSFEVASKIGVDDILSGHSFPQRRRVQNIALDD